MVVAYGLLALTDAGVGAIPAGAMPYVGAGALVLMLSGLGLKRRLVGAIPRGAHEAKRLEQYFAATIVGLALVEGGGLFLITLSIVADTPVWVLAGGGTALWMLVIGRPRREETGPGRPPHR
jgi:amino acid transporter